MLEYLISFIAPHLCIVCQKEGTLLCNECSLEHFPALPETCYKCQKISPNGRVCATCRRHSSLEHVWVRTEYEGPAKRMVQKLKFERASKAAHAIADLMLEVFPYGLTDTVVVPLPTATARMRARGYDHAALIGRALAKSRELRYQALLCRLGSTRQVGASRAKRLKQLEGAFYCPRPELIAGRDVLLVDDVMTTGASIEEAAKVMKKAGARRVSVIVFARKAVTFPQ